MTITLRSIPPELLRLLRKKADAQGTSLSKAALQLLEEGAGIGGARRRKVIHHDLDSLAGTWTKKQAAAFEKAVKAQRKIDPDLWK